MASRWLAVDKLLFLAVVGLIGLGLVMVYSASFPSSQRDWGGGWHYVGRQATAAALALCFLIAGLLIDYRAYRHPGFVAVSVAATIGALVMVLLTPAVAGVHRWISLYGFNIQPSEIAKLTLILFLACYLARRDERINEVWAGLTPALAVLAVLVLLVAAEPDLGTACALLGIAVAMLWVAGLSWRLVAEVAALGVAAAAFQILRTGYQARRILAFLDPWADQQGAGYQTVQSLIAVGSGGVSGVGLAESGQTRSFFLPYPYTDFIYAVVAEELGFIGACAVVLGFLVILWRGTRAALRAPDRFGFYLGLGLTMFLVLQAMLNMSIVVNLLPTTGIPLPLISYGGSSLAICSAAVGILLNLSQHSHG